MEELRTKLNASTEQIGGGETSHVGRAVITLYTDPDSHLEEPATS
jgi:hypothetical protein